MPSVSTAIKGVSMITARQSRMAAILLSTDSWIAGAVFSDMLGISLRTLQTEVKSLNSLFAEMRINARVISNNRLGYCFEGDRETLRRRLAKTECEDALSGKSRRDILAVLLFEADWITIGSIADRIFLAKSSVNSNLSEIRRMFEDTSAVRLTVHPRKGIRLEAPESVKRALCAELLDESMTEFLSVEALPDAFYDLAEMRNILIHAFTPDDHIVEGEGFELIARWCVFSGLRSTLGFEIEPVEQERVQDRIIRIRDEMEERLGYRFSDAELIYLQRYIRRFNVIGITKTDDRNTEQEIQQFISVLNNESGMNVSISEKDLKRFSEQLQRTRYRMENGLETPVRNASETCRLFPIALHFIHTVFSRVTGLSFPDSEAEQIVPFVSSLLDDLRPKADLYIVSDHPISELYRYRRRLRAFYDYYVGRIHLIPLYLYEQRYRMHIDNAIFLTTDPQLFFQEDNMHYLDVTEEITSMEHLSRMFRNHYAQRAEAIIRSFEEQFSGNELELSNQSSNLLQICREAGFSVCSERTNLFLTGGSAAAVIEHGTGSHHRIQLSLKQPVPFRGHVIHTIDYVYLGSADNSYYFFEYIRFLLNGRV